MSRRDPLSELRSHVPAILPSMLGCDFGNLEREVRSLEDAGAPGLHLDVMDGHFVPNFTYGMPIVAGIRRLTDLPLDVHLMIAEPQRYAEQFVEAGADLITFHVEATSEPAELLRSLRSRGVAAGVALNPDTPLADIESCLPLCDLVLVMSVAAGFGGQDFNPVALDKLRKIKEQAGDKVLLEIDGGINAGTIEDCAEAGAQAFVVGSAIFSRDRQQHTAQVYRKAVQNLRKLALEASCEKTP